MSKIFFPSFMGCKDHKCALPHGHSPCLEVTRKRVPVSLAAAGRVPSAAGCAPGQSSPDGLKHSITQITTQTKKGGDT